MPFENMHLRPQKEIIIVGGGLAGCEAAWQASRRGCNVLLYEMKPARFSPAHHNPHLAELVCSNSLRAESLEKASGLLKEELRRCGSLILAKADAHRVPAGAALAVDRAAFAADITAAIEAHPAVRVIREEITVIPPRGIVIVATGPLTSDHLAACLTGLLGADLLYFHDAVSPIVEADSIDFSKTFRASRYAKGTADYINCPLSQDQYYRFVGESNRERIQNRSGFYKVPRRIVAPTGSEDPFYYSIETHYGASDHMVFNDWGVGVPGVMMIAWPDQWYHTSGDRIDKSDPTQMKRVAVIGAAAAYTIASADDNMAMRLAGETASNGARRLGHQLMMGLERLNNTTAENFEHSYRWARAHVEASVINERATLATILELADDTDRVGEYVGEMQEMIEQVGERHLGVLETHMEAVAAGIGIEPVRLRLTNLERNSSRCIFQYLWR